MIDRAALENVARKHLDGLGSATGGSLILRLATGETFAVKSFIEFLDAYCVVAVYPEEPLAAEDLGKRVPRDDKGRLIFDRLILPYHVVVHVTLSAREPERRGKMGF